MKHERVELDGHRLASLRVDRALTQGELAGMAGVTSRTIYRAPDGSRDQITAPIV